MSLSRFLKPTIAKRSRPGHPFPTRTIHACTHHQYQKAHIVKIQRMGTLRIQSSCTKHKGRLSFLLAVESVPSSIPHNARLHRLTSIHVILYRNLTLLHKTTYHPPCKIPYRINTRIYKRNAHT
ncbi:hypothetical protein SpCBS45565_g01542 [Spizellomyces sp. 'palustris']|nr:hypothetical protein SpCBS45565_g01542 [Spizellomyces sp. 'palustris']